MWQLGILPTAACDCLEIDYPQVINGGVHLDYGGAAVVETGRNSEGMRQKTTPNWKHSTCRQLELSASKHSPRSRGTLLMECVRAPGVPDSSRRLPETTHEVFSWTRSFVSAAQKKSQKSLTWYYFNYRRQLVLWLHHWWTDGFHQEFAVFLADRLNY